MSPEPLTEPQLAELEADLLALQAELEATLLTSMESVATVALDTSIGRLSRMDAMQGQALNKATRHRLQMRLNQVHAALKRLANDEYGWCVVSDEPIGYPRLKARPETPMNLKTQQNAEARRRR